MRWTKLKSIIESLFAPSLAGRLRIHTTGYGNSGFGRSWIAWDGQTMANFSDEEAIQRKGFFVGKTLTICEEDRNPDALVEKGELSSVEFRRACFEFKDMNVSDALSSDDIILHVLAATHKKVGRRRLLLLEQSDRHPLVKAIIELRNQSR